MRIFPPALDIRDNEGFSSEKDIFGRAELGRGLKHFLSTISDPTVIALDAQWGSGKTTFLKMWAGELRNAGFPVVYFDAFEHDYFEDAFLAIAGEIIALAEDKRKAATPAGQDFIRKAKSVGKVVGRGVLSAALKGASLGAIDFAELTETGEEIAKAFAEQAEGIFDKHIDEMLTQQRVHKSTIESFRSALTELPKLLVSNENAAPEEPKPLIFIIDELDRCRPIFALQILERIKHFFSVENIHFVLGVHLGQLQNSVASAYGAEINSQLYLEKFIQLIVPLLDTPNDPMQLTPGRYVGYLARVMDIKDENINVLLREISTIANRRNLSLRSIERIMSTLAISIAFAGNTIRPPVLLAGLCVLKILHPQLFVKAKQGTLKFEEVEAPLTLDWPTDDHQSNRREWVLGWWRFCLDPTMEAEDVKSYYSALKAISLSRKDVVPVIANWVVDRLHPAG